MEENALQQQTIKPEQKKINLDKNEGKEEKYKKSSSFFLHKVKMLDIVLSIKHLSLMLRSGLAIEDALKVLSKQTNDVKLKSIYHEILLDVGNGSTLSEAMKKYKNEFSDVVVSLVNAGEQGGTLEKNLLFLADYLKKDYDLKRKIKGALFYPIIILGITVAEMLGVVFFILPNLETLFSSFKQKAEFTEMVMSVARFIRSNISFIVLGILALVVFYKYLGKTKVGKKMKNKVALSFPIFKVLNKNTILTSFSRTLGILLQSGIPIAKCLAITSDTVGNYYYSKAILEIYEEVKKGKTISESMEKYKDLFPSTFAKLIEVGEATGTLEENLLYLHEFYSEDVEEMSANMSNLIEPLLLVFIGLMIGTLAISIVGPMYQITSSIN